jgi:hypothetical protein
MPRSAEELLASEEGLSSIDVVSLNNGSRPAKCHVTTESVSGRSHRGQHGQRSELDAHCAWYLPAFVSQRLYTFCNSTCVWLSPDLLFVLQNKLPTVNLIIFPGIPAAPFLSDRLTAFCELQCISRCAVRGRYFTWHNVPLIFYSCAELPLH